ncbi:ATP-grasp domain-containing protein [Chitinophaga sp. RAB17]|uniref:ATP-grasp domain-containing protein n=1 Tax=Chitinophaga sp. RAB17 TaxID=3233049 RepID=UPI003F9073B6
MNKRIALVTYQQQARYTAGVTVNEDEQLLKFLQEKGLDITSVVWNAPEINWQEYDVAIIKSPWDYHDQIDTFYAWLKTTEQAGVQLLNSAEMIAWNSNKKYLLEIAAAGLPIIPSKLIEKGESPDWKSFFGLWHTDKIVVKPCVSAGAKNTMLLTVEGIEEKRDQLTALLQIEDYLVQPYLNEIEEGEWSFVFFGGVFSHSVLKTPKQGDFRVQHYHGGTISTVPTTDIFIHKAEAYVDHFGKGSLYVRVDGLIKEGEFYLMELEMIEPYLFLSTAENGYENYYKALMTLLQ